MASHGDSRQPNSDTIRMRPAVIVGLGGTGKEVVALVREYLIDEYGSLDNIPIVAFVVIDTDSGEPEAQHISAMARQIKLAPDEWVYASIPDTGVIWRQRENLPHLREWLPPNLEGLGHVSQGAKQIRALGRLAFFHNYQQIYNAFTRARDKVVNTNNAAVMSQQGIEVDPTSQNDPEYYIVSSLAGGTGSGMFLDVAFLLKQLDHRNDDSPVTAFFAMPDVFADCSVGRINPNAYAALKEINYFTYNARDRESNEYLDPRYNGNAPWQVQYAEGAAVREVMPPPFRYCYLVGMQNGSVRFTTDKRHDFFEMLAHNIVLDFSSAFGAYRRSARDNPGEGFMAPDVRGLPQSFCSFGLSSLRFPSKSVLNACACRLCSSVLQLWAGTLRGAATQRAIDNTVTQFYEKDLRFANAEGPNAAKLMARLLATGGDGGGPFAQLEAWRTDQSDRVARGRSRANETCTRLHNAVRQLQENTHDDGSADPTRWGPWLRSLRNRAERLRGEIRQQIRDGANQLLADEFGPESVAGFLDKLGQRLETFRSELEKQLGEESQLKADTERRQSAMQSQLARTEALSSAWVFDKGRVVAGEADRYVTLTKQYYEAVIGLKAVQLGERLLADLVRETELLSNQMLELLAYLEDLQARFDEYGDEWAARAAGQMVNGISLFEGAGTVQQCYEMDVPVNGEIEIAQSLGRSVLASLKTDLMSCLHVPKLDLRRMLFEQATRGYFPHVQDISAAEILRNKPEEEVERLLKQVYDRSEPFLRIIEQTPGFNSAAMVRNYLVGVQGGQESADPHVQAILPKLGQLPNVQGRVHALPKGSKDEIIIGQELYTYPLRAIAEMEDMQTDYKRYLCDVAEFPIHISRGWEESIPDHVPVAPQVEQEARTAAAVGLALGIVKHPQADSREWVYEYVGDAGLTETSRLTREPDFSMLWRRLADDYEVRPRLLGEIVAEAEKAAAEGKQGDLHAKLKAYVDQLAERHGSTSIVYKQQHKPISDFITDYHLAT